MPPAEDLVHIVLGCSKVIDIKNDKSILSVIENMETLAKTLSIIKKARRRDLRKPAVKVTAIHRSTNEFLSRLMGIY